jgi:hypothetical protein
VRRGSARSIRLIARAARPLAASLAAVIASWNVLLFTVAVSSAPIGRPLFDDLAIYQQATSRVLAGQSWFLDRQLGGSYAIQHGDVLYPPVSAFFFGPWLVLPAWTFVAMAVSIVAAYVLIARPSVFVWPVLALFASDPTTLLLVMFGNPGLWTAAFIALGLRFGWPGVLVLLKPSVGPLALVGIHRRGWWFGLATLGLGSLVLLEHTLQYPRVLVDAHGGGIGYSIASLPMTVIPLIAWLGGDGVLHVQAAITRLRRKGPPEDGFERRPG